VQSPDVVGFFTMKSEDELMATLENGTLWCPLCWNTEHVSWLELDWRENIFYIVIKNYLKFFVDTVT